MRLFNRQVAATDRPLNVFRNTWKSLPQSNAWIIGSIRDINVYLKDEALLCLSNGRGSVVQSSDTEPSFGAGKPLTGGVLTVSGALWTEKVKGDRRHAKSAPSCHWNEYWAMSGWEFQIKMFVREKHYISHFTSGLPIYRKVNRGLWGNINRTGK